MTKLNNDIGFLGNACLFEDVQQDQPCIYGVRVDGHAVYCNHPEGPRKCRHSGYWGRAYSLAFGMADENCELFEPNPNYHEDKEALEKEIKTILKYDKAVNEYVKKLTDEGYLCHNCVNAFACRKKKYVYCCVGTLVTGEIPYREDGNYTQEEIDTHFQADPILVPIRKECRFFKPRPKL